MTKDQTHPHEWHVQAVLDRLRRPDSPVCVGKGCRPLDWPGRRRRMQSLTPHPPAPAIPLRSFPFLALAAVVWGDSKRNHPAHRRAHPSFGKRLTDIMNILIGPETRTVGNQSPGTLFRSCYHTPPKCGVLGTFPCPAIFLFPRDLTLCNNRFLLGLQVDEPPQQPSSLRSSIDDEEANVHNLCDYLRLM